MYDEHKYYIITATHTKKKSENTEEYDRTKLHNKKQTKNHKYINSIKKNGTVTALSVTLRGEIVGHWRRVRALWGNAMFMANSTGCFGARRDQ